MYHLFSNTIMLFFSHLFFVSSLIHFPHQLLLSLALTFFLSLSLSLCLSPGLYFCMCHCISTWLYSVHITIDAENRHYVSCIYWVNQTKFDTAYLNRKWQKNLFNIIHIAILLHYKCIYISWWRDEIKRKKKAYFSAIKLTRPPNFIFLSSLTRHNNLKAPLKFDHFLFSECIVVIHILYLLGLMFPILSFLHLCFFFLAAHCSNEATPNLLCALTPYVELNSNEK